MLTLLLLVGFVLITFAMRLLLRDSSGGGAVKQPENTDKIQYYESKNKVREFTALSGLSPTRVHYDC